MNQHFSEWNFPVNDKAQKIKFSNIFYYYVIKLIYGEKYLNFYIFFYLSDLKIYNFFLSELLFWNKQ